MAQTSASPGLTPTVYPNRLLKYAKKGKKRDRRRKNPLRPSGN